MRRSISAVQFLLDQAGPRNFVQFIEMGMMTENWQAALQKFYAYESIGDFQVNWNQWLRDGSPQELASYAPLIRNQTNDSVIKLASGELPSNSIPPDSLSMTPSSVDDEESWYKRKLQETSGAPATSIPPPNHFSGHPAHGLRSSGSVGGPRVAQIPLSK